MPPGQSDHSTSESQGQQGSQGDQTSGSTSQGTGEKSGTGSNSKSGGQSRGQNGDQSGAGTSGERGSSEASNGQNPGEGTGKGEGSQGHSGNPNQGNEAGGKSGAPSQGASGGQQSQQGGQQGAQANHSGGAGGSQPGGGQPTGEPGQGNQQGSAGPGPIGGGGRPGPGSTGEHAKDDSKPSPRATDPENPSAGEDIAPQGQAQTDMVLRTVKDLLAKDAVTPDLEKETGMTREQMEQFVKKYEKVKSAPAGPGREIAVKPGDREPTDRPSANLPGFGRQERYSTKSQKDRGQMVRDDVQNNLEGISFKPPPEFRSKFEGYRTSLARTRSGASSKPAGPACPGRGKINGPRYTCRFAGPPMLSPLALPRRYLVGFDPRELPHHFTDVLIIGGGIAGIRAALGVPDDYRALVVTKDEVRESNSHYAQGGIAGVLDPEDRFDNHIADTLTAGKGLCEPEVVEHGGTGSTRSDQRADRLGHPFRPGRRPGLAGAGRGTFARQDRTRPGRRDRARDHAGDDPPGPIAAVDPDLAELLDDRPAHP